MLTILERQRENLRVSHSRWISSVRISLHRMLHLVDRADHRCSLQNLLLCLRVFAPSKVQGQQSEI